MMNKKTKISFDKRLPFWAIVCSGDAKGYHTGYKKIEVCLYEFETARELQDFLSDGSVESGKSMGDFTFNVLALFTTFDILKQMVEAENQEGD